MCVLESESQIQLKVGNESKILFVELFGKTEQYIVFYPKVDIKFTCSVERLP